MDAKVLEPVEDSQSMLGEQTKGVAYRAEHAVSMGILQNVEQALARSIGITRSTDIWVCMGLLPSFS